ADDYVTAFTQDIDRSRVFAAEAVMADPHPLDLATDTAQSALERMERLGRDALHVLDGGRIAGVVTYRDLAAAAKGGGTVRDALIGDYPQAQRGTHLYRLFTTCAGGLPLAVLREIGRAACRDE